MLTRTVTGLIGIPALLFIIISGGWILKITIIAISLMGFYEFCNALSKKYNPIRNLGFGLVIMITSGTLYNEQTFKVFLAVLIIVILIEVVNRYPKYTIVDASITAFGVLYLGFLFPFVSLVREMAMGGFFVWLIFISAWGTDTFAYFTGYFLGKNKLAPVLSPKKTIEGAIGGIIGAALLGLVYAWVYGTYYNGDVMPYLLVVPLITALGSVVAQFGDLSASTIKRSLDVKDFGYILPGHGGILDRFDSVLFTAPFIYITLYFFF